jgi:predicted RNA-binding Zn-ribbon protein involved in translation (DUF1610 family)
MDPKSIIKLKKTSECLNCHIDITEHNFCPNCGQQNVDKQASLRDFLHDALGDLFTFDHKFFRSFKPLLFKPGFLTNEYNKGRRVNYTLPLRLYFFVSLVFFFVWSLEDTEDSGFLDMTSNRSLPMDTVVDYLMTYDNVKEIDALRLNRKITSHFQKIRNNRDGQNWNRFFTDVYVLDDSTRNKIAFRMFFKFDLDLYDADDVNRRDSTYLINTLTDSISLFKPEEAQDIFRRINGHHDISRNYFHSNQLANNLMRRYTRKTFNDTIQADNIRRDLLTQFVFSRDSSSVSLDIDSAETGFFANLGRRIEEQGRKADKDDKSGALIYQGFLDHFPKIIFALLPIFALILKLFYVRRGIYYINHLIFALHSHTIIFLYLLFANIFDFSWIYWVVVPGIWFHILFSMMNVYGQHWFKSAIKLNMILFIYAFFVLIGVVIALLISLFQL